MDVHKRGSMNLECMMSLGPDVRNKRYKSLYLIQRLCLFLLTICLELFSAGVKKTDMVSAFLELPCSRRHTY